jgi:hypothetical protein
MLISRLTGSLIFPKLLANSFNGGFSMEERRVKPDTLVVVWSSGDKEVATKMAFLYTLNAKRRGWWGNVTLIVWGPSAKLLTQDRELQDRIGEMREAGVGLKACKACSDSYGASESLEKLGVEVQYMGEPFTQILKDEYQRVITF